MRRGPELAILFDWSLSRRLGRERFALGVCSIAIAQVLSLAFLGDRINVPTLLVEGFLSVLALKCLVWRYRDIGRSLVWLILQLLILGGSTAVQVYIWTHYPAFQICVEGTPTCSSAVEPGYLHLLFLTTLLIGSATLIWMTKWSLSQSRNIAN